MRARRSSTHLSSAQKALELSVAAPQVVAHRIDRMLRAGPQVSAHDWEEFMLMGSEKVLAFYQSWAAMWLEAFELQARFLGSWWLWLPTTPHTAAQHWHHAVGHQIEAGARVLHAGLKPVHAKAVSNAKRLARHRKRK